MHVLGGHEPCSQLHHEVDIMHNAASVLRSQGEKSNKILW